MASTEEAIPAKTSRRPKWWYKKKAKEAEDIDIKPIWWGRTSEEITKTPEWWGRTAKEISKSTENLTLLGDDDISFSIDEECSSFEEPQKDFYKSSANLNLLGDDENSFSIDGECCSVDKSFSVDDVTCFMGTLTLGPPTVGPLTVYPAYWWWGKTTLEIYSTPIWWGRTARDIKVNSALNTQSDACICCKLDANRLWWGKTADDIIHEPVWWGKTANEISQLSSSSRRDLLGISDWWGKTAMEISLTPMWWGKTATEICDNVSLSVIVDNYDLPLDYPSWWGKTAHEISTTPIWWGKTASEMSKIPSIETVHIPFWWGKTAHEISSIPIWWGLTAAEVSCKEMTYVPTKLCELSICQPHWWGRTANEISTVPIWWGKTANEMSGISYKETFVNIPFWWGKTAHEISTTPTWWGRTAKEISNNEWSDVPTPVGETPTNEPHWWGRTAIEISNTPIWWGKTAIETSSKTNKETFIDIPFWWGKTAQELCTCWGKIVDEISCNVWSHVHNQICSCLILSRLPHWWDRTIDETYVDETYIPWWWGKTANEISQMKHIVPINDKSSIKPVIPGQCISRWWGKTAHDISNTPIWWGKTAAEISSKEMPYISITIPYAASPSYPHWWGRTAMEISTTPAWWGRSPHEICTWWGKIAEEISTDVWNHVHDKVRITSSCLPHSDISPIVQTVLTVRFPVWWGRTAHEISNNPVWWGRNPMEISTNTFNYFAMTVQEPSDISSHWWGKTAIEIASTPLWWGKSATEVSLTIPSTIVEIPVKSNTSISAMAPNITGVEFPVWWGRTAHEISKKPSHLISINKDETSTWKPIWRGNSVQEMPSWWGQTAKEISENNQDYSLMSMPPIRKAKEAKEVSNPYNNVTSKPIPPKRRGKIAKATSVKSLEAIGSFEYTPIIFNAEYKEKYDSPNSIKAIWWGKTADEIYTTPFCTASQIRNKSVDTTEQKISYTPTWWGQSAEELRAGVAPKYWWWGKTAAEVSSTPLWWGRTAKEISDNSALDISAPVTCSESHPSWWGKTATEVSTCPSWWGQTGADAASPRAPAVAGQSSASAPVAVAAAAVKKLPKNFWWGKTCEEIAATPAWWGLTAKEISGNCAEVSSTSTSSSSECIPSWWGKSAIEMTSTPAWWGRSAYEVSCDAAKAKSQKEQVVPEPEQIVEEVSVEEPEAVAEIIQNGIDDTQSEKIAAEKGKDTDIQVQEMKAALGKSGKGAYQELKQLVQEEPTVVQNSQRVMAPPPASGASAAAASNGVDFEDVEDAKSQAQQQGPPSAKSHFPVYSQKMVKARSLVSRQERLFDSLEVLCKEFRTMDTEIHLLRNQARPHYFQNKRGQWIII